MTATGGELDAFPFAVVILAGRASPADRDRVAEMVSASRGLGAHAIVAAVPRGWRAPPHSRVVHATPGAPSISSVRLAMAQLSNTPARWVLLWPLSRNAAIDPPRLVTLVQATRHEGAAMAALEGDDPDHAPVMIARESWLDLMTLGEQGMHALAERLAMHLVPPP